MRIVLKPYCFQGGTKRRFYFITLALAKKKCYCKVIISEKASIKASIVSQRGRFTSKLLLVQIHHILINTSISKTRYRSCSYALRM